MFRIRQAKWELHRARAQVSPPRCSEPVKLRGNSTGHASRCRLRGVRKRLQSVRVCRGCVATSPGRETQNCRRKAFACVAGVSPQVLVAKRRTVVDSGLESCHRVSTVPTITGMRGVAKRRTVVDLGLVSCRRVWKAKPPQVLVAKRRTVSAFWPRVVSSRLKSANNHRDEGGPGRETLAGPARPSSPAPPAPAAPTQPSPA